MPAARRGGLGTHVIFMLVKMGNRNSSSEQFQVDGPKRRKRSTSDLQEMLDKEEKRLRLKREKGRRKEGAGKKGGGAGKEKKC